MIPENEPKLTQIITNLREENKELVIENSVLSARINKLEREIQQLEMDNADLRSSLASCGGYGIC